MASENVEKALADIATLRVQREEQTKNIMQQSYLVSLATLTALRALLIEISALRDDLAKRP